MDTIKIGLEVRYRHRNHDFPEDDFDSKALVSCEKDLFAFLKKTQKEIAEMHSNSVDCFWLDINRISFYSYQYVEINGERFIKPEMNYESTSPLITEPWQQLKAIVSRAKTTLKTIHDIRERKALELKERNVLKSLQEKYRE